MEISQVMLMLTSKIDELVADAECIGKRLKHYGAAGAPEGNIVHEYITLLNILKQLEVAKIMVIARYPKYERVFNELLPALVESRFELAELVCEK